MGLYSLALQFPFLLQMILQAPQPAADLGGEISDGALLLRAPEPIVVSAELFELLLIAVVVVVHRLSHLQVLGDEPFDHLLELGKLRAVLWYAHMLCLH